MRAFFSTIVILLCMQLPVFSDPKSDYYTAFTAASNAKDWSLAEKTARAAITAFPDETGFALNLAWSLRSLKRFDEALAILRPLAARLTTDKNVVDNLVWALLEAGWDSYNTKELPKAFAVFSEAYKLRPEDEWVLNAYGISLRDTGELSRSREILEKGFRLYPKNEYIKPNLLWTCILQANSSRDRARDLEKANPADQRVASLRREAVQMYLRAGELDPKNESYLLNYGGYLLEQAKNPEARILFEQGEKLYPDKTWWADNIQYSMQEETRKLAKDKKYTEAFALLEKAITRFSNEAWFQTDKIDWYFQITDYARSARALGLFAANKHLQEYRKPLTCSKEELVLFRSQRLVWKFAEIRDWSSGFAMLDALETAMGQMYFIHEQRGILYFQKGETEKGINLAYKAYDLYISSHPEAKKTITLPLPIAGPVNVAGNSRRDAITHAGLNQYCYDFMGSDPAGNLLKPGIVFPGNHNSDYYGFGMNIYSPVDGVVEDVVDSYADISPRVNPVLGDGNSIFIKDAAGYHYLFAHIRQGSSLVIKGQQVRRGDRIAEMGNTGYTAIPHFHFGVYTADWLVSIEVKFEGYTLLTQEGRKEERITVSSPRTGDVIRR
ncbi:MAG: hypothetical protein EHM28_01560 [Spirochaetaceae bacterium]|nr:MAG: hypothetical protein EHM28_01560 [Spirochaetaceae bacterium]